MQRIKDEVKDKKIWVSIDETTDVKGRYVVNVIIGTMEVAQMPKITWVNAFFDAYLDDLFCLFACLF